jgi:heptaprenyl diphosphate synthase
MKNNNQRVAYFAGLSAFIGVIENFIPLPIPFVRLGLSNIPIVLGFTIFNFRESFFIVIFKVVFSHLFRGTLFSYPFIIGLSGNLFFIFLTYPVYHFLKKYISFVSLNVIGAFFHNFGQLMVAYLFVLVPLNVLMLFGLILLAFGLVLGFINGIICNAVYDKIFLRIIHE